MSEYFSLYRVFRDELFLFKIQYFRVLWTISSEIFTTCCSTSIFAPIKISTILVHKETNLRIFPKTRKWLLFVKSDGFSQLCQVFKRKLDVDIVEKVVQLISAHILHYLFLNLVKIKILPVFRPTRSNSRDFGKNSQAFFLCTKIAEISMRAKLNVGEHVVKILEKCSTCRKDIKFKKINSSSRNTLYILDNCIFCSWRDVLDRQHDVNADVKNIKTTDQSTLNAFDPVTTSDQYHCRVKAMLKRICCKDGILGTVVHWVNRTEYQQRVCFWLCLCPFCFYAGCPASTHFAVDWKRASRIWKYDRRTTPSCCGILRWHHDMWNARQIEIAETASIGKSVSSARV